MNFLYTGKHIKQVRCGPDTRICPVSVQYLTEQVEKNRHSITMDATPIAWIHDHTHTNSILNGLIDRYKFQSTCLMYKSMHYMSQSYISELFIPLSDLHKYPTSSVENQNGYIDKRNLSLCQRAFSVQGHTIWNPLPADVKSAASHLGMN